MSLSRHPSRPLTAALLLASACSGADPAEDDPPFEPLVSSPVVDTAPEDPGLGWDTAPVSDTGPLPEDPCTIAPRRLDDLDHFVLYKGGLVQTGWLLDVANPAELPYVEVIDDVDGYTDLQQRLGWSFPSRDFPDERVVSVAHLSQATCGMYPLGATSYAHPVTGEPVVQVAIVDESAGCDEVCDTPDSANVVVSVPVGVDPQVCVRIVGGCETD